jgi:hemerythrin
MVDQGAASEQVGYGLADIEAEHALQFKLLNETERLLAGGEGARAREVAWQLYDYSEAHFASEQVLMRMHAYPGYQAHEREHGDLLVALANLLKAHVEGGSDAAGTLRRWLTAHIQHADQAFVDFVRAAGASSAT